MFEKSFVSGIHPSRMLTRFTDLWRSKSLCDTTLEVGPVKVYVHRLVLFSVCPSLMQIVEYGNCSWMEIRLPAHITTDALNAFLHFCYTGVLPLSISNVYSVQHLAQIFKVDTVLKFCRSYKSALRKNDVHESMLSTTSEKLDLPVVVSVCQEENVTKISFMDTKSEFKEVKEQIKGDFIELDMPNKEFKSYNLQSGESFGSKDFETKIKNVIQTSKNCESLPGVNNQKDEGRKFSGGSQEDFQMKVRSIGPVSEHTDHNEINTKDRHNCTNNENRDEMYDETFCSERKGCCKSLYDTKLKKRLHYPSTVCAALLRNNSKSSNNASGHQQENEMLKNRRSMESEKWSVGKSYNRLKDITDKNCNLQRGFLDFNSDVTVDESTCSFKEFSDLVDEYMNMESPLVDIEPIDKDPAVEACRKSCETSKEKSRRDDECTGECRRYSTNYSDDELQNVLSQEMNFDLNSNELQYVTDESSKDSFDTGKSHVCWTLDRKNDDQNNCPRKHAFANIQNEEMSLMIDTPTNTRADKKEVEHEKRNVARELKFFTDETQKQCLEKPMDLRIVKVTSLAGMKNPNHTYWKDEIGDVEYKENKGINTCTLLSTRTVSKNNVDLSSFKHYVSCHKEQAYQQLLPIKNWGVKVFKDWLLKHEKQADFEMMPLATINSLLEEFYTQVQIKDDGGHSFSALKTIKQCLSRYLNDSPYKRNIKFSKQEEFRSSTRVYKRLYKQCRRKTKKLNITNFETMSHCPISANDFRKLYCSRALSNDNPHSLQRKVIFEVVLHMKSVKNPCVVMLELTKSSFQKHLDNNIGRNFYTVTMKSHRNNSKKIFYIYENDDKSVCPVQSLDIYLSKLARENTAFIQKAVSHVVTLNDREWYIPQKIAKSTIAGFMAKLCEFAGLSRIYTFASVRKTSLLLEKLDSSNTQILDTKTCTVENLCCKPNEHLNGSSEDMQYNTLNSKEEILLLCSPKGQYKNTKQKYIDRVLYSVDKDGKVTIQKTTGQRKLNEENLCVDCSYSTENVDSKGNNTSLMCCHASSKSDVQSTTMGLCKDKSKEYESRCETLNYRIYKAGEQIKPLDLSIEHKNCGTGISTRTHFGAKYSDNNSSFRMYVPPKKRRHEISLYGDRMQSDVPHVLENLSATLTLKPDLKL